MLQTLGMLVNSCSNQEVVGSMPITGITDYTFPLICMFVLASVCELHSNELSTSLGLLQISTHSNSVPVTISIHILSTTWMLAVPYTYLSNWHNCCLYVPAVTWPHKLNGTQIKLKAVNFIIVQNSVISYLEVRKFRMVQKTFVTLPKLNAAPSNG